ncbi:hypothetical protein [Pygmaiobacter massiliensis]|uniref:hypothetical protein n=1 Tax=Pygmaiobacter massiliensis TaxID=1917873 RepID=UPI000C7BA48C|nr:hypothetical protein [Pygmaiobacter massiliensis]
MKLGKAFEILVKRILLNIGFSEVMSDGLYIFDGAPGQMIQGLGEAHNADVLLEPPVQTPFYSKTRLLVECKDYSRKVGLNTVRSVLGLREDINNFEIVDLNELTARRRQNRNGVVYSFERYSYQVAIASISGYTVPAQKFAATYRIPLLEFNRMPFWNEFCELISNRGIYQNQHRLYMNEFRDGEIETQIIDFADRVGKYMAVAITNSGQMLFLYRTTGERTQFSDYYSLHWNEPTQPWSLNTGEQTYIFQLPDNILKLWLDNAKNELEMKKEAINCKASFFANMIVYFTEHSRPVIKMISIDKYELERARESLYV